MSNNQQTEEILLQKNCQNCWHRWNYHEYMACGHASVLRILLFGPKLVKYNDTCKYFRSISDRTGQKTR